MSSGVSDQMKVPGNTAKNGEERNIPWSQQVDEASYENLTSPTIEDNYAAHQSASMQFQYPPFNAKENQNSSWNHKSRRVSSSNFESNKKHGKPAFYNNAKRDDYQSSTWSTNSSRRTISDNVSGNFAKPNRNDDGRYDCFPCEKLDNRPGVNEPTEEKKTSALPAVTAPKKTTWASIASQPAKLTSRTTLTTSSHKKKGPGMPPPPMVPGKHNLDVNTWDLPNNNPPPVPSPPSPIDLASTDISSDFSTGINADYNLDTRSDKTHGKGNEVQRDDNKSTYSDNFGRVRNSPNGHSRKNWSTQHPLYQGSRQSGGSSSGPLRRSDGPVSGGGAVGGSSRYGERRGHYTATRYEQDVTLLDIRDENLLRNTENTSPIDERTIESPQAVLDELRDKNNYNPADIDIEKAASARFFVIKSYSEDDIHRSIKYEIWCSTDHGNKRLDDAFKERHKEGGNVLLFFSVNGSGHFCGMAQMMTAVDYNSTSSVWAQDKWKGKFKVKWIYVKDVPNSKLRHICLENNENKPVTNSRDTQEVPNAKGIEVLQILHSYKHSTSIFDDFYHYEKKQEEEVSSKKPILHDGPTQSHSSMGRHFVRQSDERDRDRDRDGRSGAAQKHFGGNTFFRERNNLHRGGYNIYNEQRRFESHRTGICPEYQQQKERDNDVERETGEYGGGRHVQKYDFSRRDERTQSKHNNRERDFPAEHSKGELRIRTGTRENQKDNEYSSTERIRGSDY